MLSFNFEIKVFTNQQTANCSKRGWSSSSLTIKMADIDKPQNAPESESLTAVGS